MPPTIDYPARIQDALRQTVATLLSEVAEDGLPGDHHFVITFHTQHPGVDVPDWMREQYPDEMTIVMQHWFDNLVVMPDRFTVTLNFNNTPEPMVIPLAALVSFVDPSVEFGLRFDKAEDDGPAFLQEVSDDTPVDKNPVDEAPMLDDASAADNDAAAEEKGAVISLDAFRKS